MRKEKSKSVVGLSFQPVIAVVMNILLVYIIYFIARVAFLLENYSLLGGHSLTIRHLSELFSGALMFDSSAIVYTNSLYIVMMLLPVWFKEFDGYHKLCRLVFVIVNSICLATNLADSVYFPYTLRRTTTTVFHEFGNETNLLRIVGTELFRHWYLVLLFAVLVWLMWKLYRTPRSKVYNFLRASHRLIYTGIQFLALAVATLLSVAGARGGLQSGVRPITISNVNQFVERPVECGLVLNTPFALIRTIGKNVYVVPSYYPDLQSASKVFNPVVRSLKPTVKNKKNIVILIVESFGREYIGALNKDLEGGHYKGYTPNVDSLIARSCVFSHSFANGHKSIDGMPSVLCSIPMFVEPFVLTPASMNTYTGLPGLLKDWGYSTAFFHGANRGSMGFLAFSKKIGFQNYYGRQDYASDKRFGGDDDFDGNWGIWDEPFLQFFCAKMNRMRQPFMTALFTVSSHHPFVIPDKYKNIYTEGELPIHKCIRYTDMAIGKFFQSARKQSWFRNTIFIITSDHTNQSNHAEYKTGIGEFSAPVIIYDPSATTVKPGMRDAVAQQIDIMPTVLDIIGYDKPYLAFGCDVLKTPASQTYALSYLNGIYQYVKYGYTLQFDGQKVVGIYSLADRLMQHNLYGHVAVQSKMECELKAIIQQYMYRMVNDKLMPES